MSKLDVQFLDQGLHKVLFDAMPLPVFVVDSDVSILEYNAAAAALIGRNRRAILRRRGGEVLHCVHATETADGCGHSLSCPDCVVRNSVRAAASGKKVTRKSAPMELLLDGKTKPVNLKVTTQPFSYEGHSYILLVLEGLSADNRSHRRA